MTGVSGWRGENEAPWRERGSVTAPLMPRTPAVCVLLISLFASGVVYAADEEAAAPVASMTLVGGFSVRETALDLTRVPETPSPRGASLNGVSPTFLRLRGDWLPLRWLGVEVEVSADLFRADKDPKATDPSVTLPAARSRRLAGRAGVALRWASASGFAAQGALGYGLSSIPVVLFGADRTTTRADSIAVHGPAVRVAASYTGSRLEASLGLQALLPLGGSVEGVPLGVLSLEPEAWLGARVLDVGPARFSAGVDYGLLLERSVQKTDGTYHYLGVTHRVSIGLRLTPVPAVAAGPVAPLAPTTLRVRVTLPSGAPAAGAQVSLAGAAPQPVDAAGEWRTTVEPGAFEVSATLPGHREAKATAGTRAAQETLVTLRLEPRTGPGSLAGVVRAAATGAAVAGARVTAGALPPITTGADGAYRFEALGPGPVEVKVEAPGLNPAAEVAQVPPEAPATLDVALDPLGKGSPATVRGLIRSRTGEPLRASVVVKGVAQRVEVSPEGRFVLTVPGGTYQFVISAPGYVSQTKSVVLNDGDQAIFHAELQKVAR